MSDSLIKSTSIMFTDVVGYSRMIGRDEKKCSKISICPYPEDSAYKITSNFPSTLRISSFSASIVVAKIPRR